MGKPVRVALIGAGKFGSMFLSQAPTIRGLVVAVIADLDTDRAKATCRNVGWDDTRIAATPDVVFARMMRLAPAESFRTPGTVREAAPLELQHSA